MYFFHIVVCFDCSVSCFFRQAESRSFAAVISSGATHWAISRARLRFPHSIIPTAVRAPSPVMR